MSRTGLAILGLLAGTAFGQPAPAAAPASSDPSADISAASDRAAAAPATALPAAQSAGGVPAIEHDGQSFLLANRTATRNAETDEYLVAGETLAEWTQLLTVQRLTLARPAGSDEFLAYFEKCIVRDGASFDVVKQSPVATVFAVRFPKSDKNDEQVMICLAFTEAKKPLLLNIVQYAIKPTRAPVAVVEMRLRSWKDAFVRQAGARAGGAQ